jgi:hypothetical protein
MGSPSEHEGKMASPPAANLEGRQLGIEHLLDLAVGGEVIFMHPRIFH